jgi:hypothetical protein
LETRAAHYLKQILRNALRHKSRTSATVLGLVVAILSFNMGMPGTHAHELPRMKPRTEDKDH